VALALLLVLAVTGAAATVFYRPYGPDVRAQLGTGTGACGWRWPRGCTTCTWSRRWALAAAGGALVALAARPATHRGRGGDRLAGAGWRSRFLATGFVAPWERLCPGRRRWLEHGPADASRAAGALRRADRGQRALRRRAVHAWRRRFGPKATGRVYFTHVLVLPALTVIAVLFAGAPPACARSRLTWCRRSRGPEFLTEETMQWRYGLCLTVLLAASSAGAQTRRPVDEPPSRAQGAGPTDEERAKSIEAQLQTDPVLRDDQVSIEVTGKRVRLSAPSTPPTSAATPRRWCGSPNPTLTVENLL
jgi:hypothetical protein